MRDSRTIHGAMGGARGDHKHSSVPPRFGVVCSPVSAAGVIDLFVLTTLFLSYTIFVTLNLSSRSVREFALFFAVGVFSTLALLYARPR